MRVHRILSIAVLAVCLLGIVSPKPAAALFHLMQIEQVIGGVDGSVSVQAVQLRMRSGSQNLITGTKLIAYDASGANPVQLISFPSSVANSSSGSRILAATAAFSAATNPPLTPDFVLTNPIPMSYLAAGSLVFEDGPGNILWRVSWGGGGYTGSGTGALTNDLDGIFNPPIVSGLPSGADQAIVFPGPNTALSTNNLADYALTSGAAVFTNNAGESGTILSLVDVGDEGAKGILALGSPFPNPSRGAFAYSVTLPRQTTVRVGIFNAGGRLVRSLVNGSLPAGRHTFRFDTGNGRGESLSTGVYWLAMTVDGERRAKRFVLMQ